MTAPQHRTHRPGSFARTTRAVAIVAVTGAGALAGCGTSETDRLDYVAEVTAEWTTAAERAMAGTGVDPTSLGPDALGWTPDRLVAAGDQVCDGATSADLLAPVGVDLGQTSADIIVTAAHRHLC
ncbi:hypothetical protein GCM10009772_45510 [Pseudonocardia alni subsp. carboxydivorans]|uniref:DUF732 domain-containing protein n=1 Tax=Pseudonocardia alni subsp. carboxydivorans TaxID=415010 RepID=A0ABU9AEE4_PSEA5